MKFLIHKKLKGKNQSITYCIDARDKKEAQKKATNGIGKIKSILQLVTC